MAIVSKGQPGEPGDCRVRIAATGDVHCGREGDREHWAAAFDRLRGQVDLILLAGDLTTHGEPEQAAILADARQHAQVALPGVHLADAAHPEAGEELLLVQHAGEDARQHRMIDQGQQVLAARVLGVSPSTLYRKLESWTGAQRRSGT